MEKSLPCLPPLADGARNLFDKQKGGDQLTETESAVANDYAKGDRSDFFIYNATIRYAKLMMDEKALLRFYSDVHNWKKGKWSNYSTHRICSLLAMSPKTFRRVRKSLVELGWIVVHERGERQAPKIELRVGRDNPKYDKLECARWWIPEGGHEELNEGNPDLNTDFSLEIEEEDEDLDALQTNMLNTGFAAYLAKEKYKAAEEVAREEWEYQALLAESEGDVLKATSLSEW